MEKLLGVKSHKAEQVLKDGSRWDVAEADSLEQDENRDAQRQRYQRHYWESVPEDGRVCLSFPRGCMLSESSLGTHCPSFAGACKEPGSETCQV